MLVYFILLAVILILGLIICRGDASKTRKIIYLSVVFTMFFVLSAARYAIGNDYFNYIRIFRECSASEGMSGIISLGYEPGFYLVNKLIGLFTQNIVVVFAVYSVIILVPAAIAIYKYSKNIWLSCFAYVCFTFFYASMGFVRQSIAAAIILVSYGFIRDRKHIAVIIVTIVATLFHYTALVLLVFYLLGLIRPTKKRLAIYGGINVVVYIAYVILKSCGLNPMNLLANIATMIFNRDFNSYINSEYFQRGLGFEYLIMPACVLTFVLVSYFLGWKQTKGADIMLNFMLFTSSCWLFTTQVFIIERFSIFIFIFVTLVIPSITEFYRERGKTASRKARAGIKRVGNTTSADKEANENYYLLVGSVVIASFIYNCFSAAMGYHGVFPYVTAAAPVQSALISMSSQEEITARICEAGEPYEYMLLMKYTSYDCYIVCGETDTEAVNGVILSAMDELGINSERIMSGSGDYIVRVSGGEITEYTGSAELELAGGEKRLRLSASPESSSIVLVNSQGEEKDLALKKNGLSIVVFDGASGALIDAIGFDLSSFGNSCVKMSH